METFDSYVLFALIALPLAGAALLIGVPSNKVGLIRWLATLVSAVILALSLYTFALYDHEAGGFQFERAWVWLELTGWPLGGQGIVLDLAIDGLSALMVLLTGIVMFTGVLVSWNVSERSKDFFILYFVLLAGVFGVFVSLDIFFLFFFYELAVLPMYLLIAVWGSSSDFGTFQRTKEYSAMKLMMYLVAGSVLIWIAIIAIFVQADLGTFGLRALQEGGEFSPTFQRVFFPFLMVGFGILAGLWPFHTWSPDGHVAAPTSVSMVHAGVLMKLGAYGIIRLGIGLMPEGAQEWMPVLVALGAVNVIYGALSAMGQRDLKYVVGYSSVSHMGYVLMGIATLHELGLSGAILQMFSHGIMTALFFVLIGAIYDRTHTRDIGVLEGMSKRMGTIGVLFAVAGLTSLGLPGLSGFVAELLVFLGLFQTYPILGVLGVVGAAITAVYILRLIAKVFFGTFGEQWRDQTDISRIEGLSAGILVAFLLLMGLFPFPFVRVIGSSVDALLALVAGV
jgi:NADH-quinone oxidoreductase subunit M